MNAKRGSGSGHFEIDRRQVLKLVAGTGVAAAGSLAAAPLTARAQASTTLSLWTGYPELVPYYQAVADAYAKTNPGVSFTIFSTSLREAEQKLSAAVPTGTGPDIFDIGTNISVNFIDAGLIEPNDAGDRSVSEERRLERRSVVDFFTVGRQELWPAAARGQHGVDVLQQGDVQGGGHRRAARDLPRAGRGRAGS